MAAVLPQGIGEGTLAAGDGAARAVPRAWPRTGDAVQVLPAGPVQQSISSGLVASPEEEVHH